MSRRLSSQFYSLCFLAPILAGFVLCDVVEVDILDEGLKRDLTEADVATIRIGQLSGRMNQSTDGLGVEIEAVEHQEGTHSPFYYEFLDPSQEVGLAAVGDGEVEEETQVDPTWRPAILLKAQFDRRYKADKYDVEVEPAEEGSVEGERRVVKVESGERTDRRLGRRAGEIQRGESVLEESAFFV